MQLTPRRDRECGTALERSADAELEELLRRLRHELSADGEPLVLLRREEIARRVHRLVFRCGEARLSLVAKRTSRTVAQRTARLVCQWLPAGGFEGHGPPLRSQLASATGPWFWQILDDLGDDSLDRLAASRESVRAATQTLARLHGTFLGHPILRPVRQSAGQLGFARLDARREAAMRALVALRGSAAAHSAEWRALCDRLLGRMRSLADDRLARREALCAHAGADTLLHGDPWPQNIFVVREPRGSRVRLLDWDRLGVGPVSYDLSAYLSRFPSEDRLGILDGYRLAAAPFGIELPAEALLNDLFDAAEQSRLAECVVWAARAAQQDAAGWAFDDLHRVERWFEAVEPLLPDPAP